MRDPKPQHLIGKKGDGLKEEAKRRKGTIPSEQSSLHLLHGPLGLGGSRLEEGKVKLKDPSPVEHRKKRRVSGRFWLQSRLQV